MKKVSLTKRRICGLYQIFASGIIGHAVNGNSCFSTSGSHHKRYLEFYSVATTEVRPIKNARPSELKIFQSIRAMPFYLSESDFHKVGYY